MESSNNAKHITNFELALKCAEIGLSVFPVSDVNKRPLSEGWREYSTSDLTQVADMWMDRTCAAVAIDCSKSGLLVIDLDRNHDNGADGVAAFKKLAKEHGGIPDVPRVLTPNGGVHLYFKQPASGPLSNSTGDLPAGIDVRGDGGYKRDTRRAPLPKVIIRFLPVVLSLGSYAATSLHLVEYVGLQPKTRRAKPSCEGGIVNDGGGRLAEGSVTLVAKSYQYQRTEMPIHPENVDWRAGSL